MDWLVICDCGHSSVLHDERGCRAGRYRPCGCMHNEAAAVQAAVSRVRVRDRSELEAQSQKQHQHGAP